MEREKSLTSLTSLTRLVAMDNRPDDQKLKVRQVISGSETISERELGAGIDH
jgi:hypothetical protein